MRRVDFVFQAESEKAEYLFVKLIYELCCLNLF